MRHLSSSQRGIGLIELMISITLGLFLLSGAIGVLFSTKASYTTNNDLTWIQDNARFASTVLNRDLRMAGFFGCSSEQSFNSTLNTIAGERSWLVDVNKPVSGWDGNAADYPSTEFPAAYNSGAAAGLPSSDIVSLRRADDTRVDVSSHNANSAVIDVVGSHPFVNGEILIITDCRDTSVFQVTSNQTNKINHNQGNSVSPGNCTKFLGPQNCSNAGSNQKTFYGDDGAFIVRMKSHAYYVSLGSDGSPALFRRELSVSGTAAASVEEELVQGIENLQVIYGVDLTGDGSANRYVSAEDVSASQWQNVVTIRTHLLVRSFSAVASEPQSFRFAGNTYTPTDRFLRQEFISTIELRNRG